MMRKQSKAQDRHLLHDYCYKGDLRKVKDLLRSDPSAMDMLNRQAGVFGYTPLHEATSGRHHDVVENLIWYGAKVNSTSNGKYTPLHIAASIGDHKCVATLLFYKAAVNVKDEFGKTPCETAILNRNFKSARLLKTAEIKQAVEENSRYLGKMLESVQPGSDVTETCLQDCLDIAVKNNHHYAAGFLILRNPTNIVQCLQETLRKPGLAQTAAMLLLCVAVQNDDKDMLTCLCQQDDNLRSDAQGSSSVITREYLPAKSLSVQQLSDIRKAMKDIDIAFPVSLAVNKRKFDSAKILLFNMFCTKREADWHGLALTRLKGEWLEELRECRKLTLGWNVIKRLPKNLPTLKSLLRLDLQHNELKIVPQELFELPLLRNLNLSYNFLEELPRIVVWTGSLIYLELQGNRLRSFPDCVNGAALEYLNIADNQFFNFPSSICQVLTLTSLDISNNKDVHELPVELGRLSKLNDLNLSGSQINDPPLLLQKNTKKLIRYLSAKLRSAEKYYVMKLLIIGRANHGKTTLLRRLKGDDVFELNVSTQGIDIQEIELRRNRIGPQAFRFRCWDFAGQEDYYATHQCFLSRRSLYLLVWDVTDGKMGVSALKPWLDNLSTRVPNASVIIVGTMLDKIVDQQEEYENRMLHELEMLRSSERRYGKLQILDFAFVSSVPSFRDYRRRIELLKNLIYDVAEKMTVDGRPDGVLIMGEPIPSSYVSLEKEIEEECKTRVSNKTLPVLHREEFLSVVDRVSLKNKKDPFESEDVELATEFLHNLGTILHYDDPNQDLKDLYFISPSWLCRLMAKVIAVKEAGNFIKGGILNVKDIPFIMLKGELGAFPQEFYPKYMRLLYRFQVACQIDAYRVVVPSKLPERKPIGLDDAVDVRGLLRRRHLFDCIPYGFWSRFITRLLAFLPEMLQPVGSPSREKESKFLARRSVNVSPDGLVIRQVDEDLALCRQGAKDYLVGSSRIEVDEDLAASGLPCINQSPVMRREMLAFKGRDVCVDQARNLVCEEHEFAISYKPRSTSSSDSSNDSCELRDASQAEPIVHGPESFLSSDTSGSHRMDSNSCGKSFFRLTQESDAPSAAWPPRVDESQQTVVDEPTLTSKQKEVLEFGSSNSSMTSIIDVASLIDLNFLTLWKDGVAYNHPSLYFSVCQTASPEPNREAIETSVTKSQLGYRVLSFVVDHIRTLIKEWYPGLAGNDGAEPFVQQFIACPVCTSLNYKNIYWFDVREVFEKASSLSLNGNLIPCWNSHPSQFVDVGELCPELFFRDLPSDLVLDPSLLEFSDDQDSLLGSGAFGKVYKGKYNSKQAAVKLYNFDASPMGALDAFYDVRQEVVVLSKIRHHPFVVEFFGVVFKPNLCAVMEVAAQGTLKSAIYDPVVQLKRIVVYRVAQQIASALDFMHSLNIIYRDLKSDNILLFSLSDTADINVKLSDFGTANFMNPSGMKCMFGTVGFIAPEMLDFSEYDEYSAKVDIYSFSMVLYEMITQRKPFHDLESIPQISSAVKRGDRPIFFDVVRSRCGFITLTQLMTLGWNKEPSSRPSARDLFNQLRQPCFQLVFGVVPMEQPLNPRAACVLSSHCSVWLLCDDMKGTFVAILDMETLELREKISLSHEKFKMSSVNLVHILALDDRHVAVVLRGYSDVLVVLRAPAKLERHSAKTEILFTRSLEDETICSLACNDKFLYLGYLGGKLERIPLRQVTFGQFKDAVSLLINSGRPVSAIVTVEEQLIASNGRYLYRYAAEFDPSERRTDLKMKNAHPNQAAKQLVVSSDGKCVFVSFQCCPEVFSFSCHDLQEVSRTDCSRLVGDDLDQPDAFDNRVTCLCVFQNTLWVGLGSGHLLIFEVMPDLNLELLIRMRPYALELRELCLYPNSKGWSGPLIISLGKELNSKGYGSLAFPVTGALPLDEAYFKKYRGRVEGSPSQEAVKVCNNQKEGKVVLVWEALSAEVLRHLLV